MLLDSMPCSVVSDSASYPPPGSTSATIEVIILPDDLPEVDELFFVTLLAVAEGNQRILSGLVSEGV